MENLKIDNPCPMAIARLNKQGENYFCKSCKKEIIDFRDKSQEEIISKIGTNTCGIFNSDQLPAQQKMSFSRQTLFHALTVLSFLGFNVSPLKAAPVSRPVKNVEINIPYSASQDKDKKKEKKKKKKAVPPAKRRMGWL